MTYNQKIPPFKWFILENFPYIEEDFDALTNWQLFCKLGKEMNKIIEKTNLTGEQVENLTNAFNALKEYVDNYFENLDVQDEIDNKLDEMAEQGVLTDIIAQYLQLAGVLAYDNKQAMKQAQNLADGSIAKTLGKTTYQDGQGAFFKVRQIQNTDVVDDENIIALYDPDLVAEKIPFSNTYEIHKELENKTNKKVVLITDSYGEQNGDSDITKFFWETFKENMGLVQGSTFFHAEQSGAGFGNNAFLSRLQSLENSITDKESISDILVCGGWNDSDITQWYGTDEMFNSGIAAFNQYVKTNYPNAKITIAHISWGDPNVSHNYTVIFNQLPLSIKRYKEACNKYAWHYLTGIEYVLHQYDQNIWQSDGNHPNQAGQTLLGNELTRAFVSGSTNIHYLHSATITGSGNVELTNINQLYSEVFGDTTRLWAAKTNVGIYFKINETITPTMNCDGAHEYEMATIYSFEMIGHDLFVIDSIPIYVTGSHDGQAASTYMGFADIIVHDSKIYLRPTLFDGGQRQENINVNYIWIPNFNITAPTIYT